MKSKKLPYRGYRFPSEIISHAVWLYHRFCLSFRDVEDLLAERGITVPYASIRQWCNHFGPEYTRTLKKRSGRLGDDWYLDDVFIKIQGELHYLWRAVDQDGNTIEILIQKRRNQQAAKRLFRKLSKGHPRRMITDKLKSYSAAHREVMPSIPHSTKQYENNRAEVSLETTRRRERQMRRFKTAGQAQRFLSVHGVVNNLFRLGRHLPRACHYRMFRTKAFSEWQWVTCACST
jgi:putative transposase